MDPSRRHLMHLAAAAWLAPLAARADTVYPTGPVRLVVPFTAGSATDIIARTLGERLEKLLLHPVVIDNRPGAGGTVGAAIVAAAAPDGHALLVHSAGHVANAALYPALKYDTQKDFTPITMLCTLPNVLVVAAERGWKSVHQLVEQARENPGACTYGSAGNGSATHMNAEKFRLAAGFKATHVPYRGTPEALTDLVGGRIDWFFAPLISALPLILDGRLVALAMGSPHRCDVLPQVPTTVESGYPGSDYTFWIGLFAPSRTPLDVIERLHADTLRVLLLPEVAGRLEKLGAVAQPMDQRAFADFVHDEIVAAATLIRQAGIRVE
jgi:tripartite-type tricarboxylate transporter receptor subunit TctC